MLTALLISSLLKFGSAREDLTIRPVLAETNFPEVAFLMTTRGELVFIDVNVLRGEAFAEPTLGFLVPDFFDIILLRCEP